MIALHASQKNLFSVEPLDKSGSLDFIQQAQIPEVLVRNALGLRMVQGYQIEHEADRFRVGPQVLFDARRDVIIEEIIHRRIRVLQIFSEGFQALFFVADHETNSLQVAFQEADEHVTIFFQQDLAGVHATQQRRYHPRASPQINQLHIEAVLSLNTLLRGHPSRAQGWTQGGIGHGHLIGAVEHRRINKDQRKTQKKWFMHSSGVECLTHFRLP